MVFGWTGWLLCGSRPGFMSGWLIMLTCTPKPLLLTQLYYTHHLPGTSPNLNSTPDQSCTKPNTTDSIYFCLVWFLLLQFCFYENSDSPKITFPHAQHKNGNIFLTKLYLIIVYFEIQAFQILKRLQHTQPWWLGGRALTS